MTVAVSRDGLSVSVLLCWATRPRHRNSRQELIGQRRTGRTYSFLLTSTRRVTSLPTRPCL
jgi:hypothetical protein